MSGFAEHAKPENARPVAPGEVVEIFEDRWPEGLTDEQIEKAREILRPLMREKRPNED